MEIDKKTLEKILEKHSSSMVGRLCAKVEEVEKENIPEATKLRLIKNSIRNAIPESLRDIVFQIKCYNDGLEAHKIEFKRNDPTDSK